MFKALTPIIGILVAVGLYFTWVQPTFEEVKTIEAETAQYEEAIDKAEELNQRVSDLMRQRENITTANLERLEAFVPDTINEVSVLIDLDELASSHGLALGDIEVGEESSTTEGADEEDSQAFNDPALDPAFADPAMDPGVVDPALAQPGAGGQNTNVRSQYSTIDIGFSVTGTYDDFRSFLNELEESLLLMEVTEITFSESEGDLVTYSMTVRLYSLNAPSS